MHLPPIFAAAILWLAAASSLAAQTPPPETTSITHVTVIDVSSGTKLPDRTVVLQGDRIVSVSTTDSASQPQARVIDARGAFLIPGLWDMHVHIQDLEDMPLYLANGVTAVRMMFGVKKPDEPVPATPEVVIGSIILDGDPPVWQGSIIIHNAGDEV